MMRSSTGAAHFGAYIEPAGIQLVEYQRERNGISIVRQHSDDRRLLGLAEAGERVGAIIKSFGLPRARLSAAVRGFGSSYQIMMLPPAEPAVLGAVVRREVARLNPEMESPRVDYVLGGEIDRRKRIRPEGGIPQQEVFVGAAPELAVSAFGEELSAASVELDHLTLLPQVIQRLYERVDGSHQPTACFVDLPGGPVIAFFNERQLRLVVEPPVAGEQDIASRVQNLAEHLERGNLYLRQQFRGVELTRLLIATEPDEEAEYLERLKETLRYTVERFPGPVPEPGALVSLGAVLDGEAQQGLNLSPFAESPLVRAEKAKKQYISLGGMIVCAVAILWAVFSVAQTLTLSKRVVADQRIAQERMNTLAPLRVVASQRQQNAQSVTYLNALEADRANTQRFLRALGRATPPGVRLQSVTFQRNGAEWNVSIAGGAFGNTGADVLLGIDRFYHSLPRELALHDLVLADLNDAPPDPFGAAMKFTVTFVLSPPGGTQ
ncbi:MAG: hypothetical protein M3Z17_07700 [Gemmatimonadota bacterium]|nr:hypothetical protein [Gemmatimonadota bacterium]